VGTLRSELVEKCPPYDTSVLANHGLRPVGWAERKQGHHRPSPPPGPPPQCTGREGGGGFFRCAQPVLRPRKGHRPNPHSASLPSPAARVERQRSPGPRCCVDGPTPDFAETVIGPAKGRTRWLNPGRRGGRGRKKPIQYWAKRTRFGTTDHSIEMIIALTRIRSAAAGHPGARPLSPCRLINCLIPTCSCAPAVIIGTETPRKRQQA
jgi:hypothetical protein